jgi:hypothetical protein
VPGDHPPRAASSRSTGRRGGEKRETRDERQESKGDGSLEDPPTDALEKGVGGLGGRADVNIILDWRSKVS